MKFRIFSSIFWRKKYENESDDEEGDDDESDDAQDN